MLIVPPRTGQLKKDLATCIESVPRGALCDYGLRSTEYVLRSMLEGTHTFLGPREDTSKQASTKTAFPR